MSADFDFDCSCNFEDLYNVRKVRREHAADKGKDDDWFGVHHPLHEIQNKSEREEVDRDREG